jgi:serine/threonine-protein kinase
MARRDSAPRDLLFGLLALQNGAVTHDQLVLAFESWAAAPDSTLAEILADQGALVAESRSLLDAVADAYLRLHGGEPLLGLAALNVGRSIRENLAAAGGPDVEATLTQIGDDTTVDDPRADRTATFTVGSATSDGQRFRVLRPHARGGLGAVFVALDSELNREVALKQILDRYADNPTSRQRFLVEAEVTGGLEHPGIVPVYGLGTYGDGRPYYAMRFIRGDTLKEAIRRFHAEPIGSTMTDTAVSRAEEAGSVTAGPMGLESRDLELHKLLRRFVDVCNAVDYAHSRGVLHRDIKPGNIIVGRHGETLVVDWGLAKATGRAEPGAEERPLMPSSASGSAETLPGSALGTPAYMSPEQARGSIEDLGPRSDVYSLGATLYCLLTGKPPQEGGDVGELLRRVQDGEFPSPRQLDPAIDKGLEAVCLKAMALEPVERYASPRSLADDVERWMADEPVAAWREPPSRRLRRWMRRRRTLVTTAAAALIVALFGMSALIMVQLRANQAERRSKALIAAQFDLALNSVKTYYQGVTGDVLLTQPAMAGLKQTLLQSPRAFFEDLRKVLEAGGQRDPGTRKKLADACADLGRITSQIGKTEDAVRAYRDAITILDSLAHEQPAEVGHRIDLADSSIMLGRSERVLGRHERARAAYLDARRLLERAVAERPENARARLLLADAYNDLAILDQHLDRLGPSESSFLAAIAVRRDLDRLEPGNAEYRDGEAWTYNSLGLLYRALGKPDRAEEQYRAGIAIEQDLVRREPRSVRYRMRLADLLGNLALAQEEQGRSEEANRTNREEIDIDRALVQEQPAVAGLRAGLGAAYMNLGGRYCDLRRYGEAEEALRAGLEVMEPLSREHPEIGEYQQTVASLQNNLGLLYERTRRIDRSRAAQSEAVRIRRELARRYPAESEYRVYLAGSLANLADLARTPDEYQEALGTFTEVIGILNGVLRDARNNAIARRYLGNAYWSRAEALGHLSRLVDSLADFDRAIDLAPDDRVRTEMVTGRALTRIRADQVELAIADAEDLARPEWSLAGTPLYNVACVFSRAAEAMAARPGNVGAERTRGAADCAERALSLLRQLVLEGYFEDPARLATLRSDPDLLSLRPRPVFAAILLDAAFPARPFAD